MTIETRVLGRTGGGAGTFIRGGAARGAAAEDKNWRTGPLSQDPGVARQNWETSGIDGLLSAAGMSGMEFMLRFYEQARKQLPFPGSAGR
jgi:hypothetical protein